MLIENIHECRLAAGLQAVGQLLDSLASNEDRLWPHEHWPAIRLDLPLGVGSAGGHGPIGYTVEAYQPGRLLKFLFTRPSGYHGHHWLEVQPDGDSGSILRHTIRMQATGKTWLSWQLILRPLHDALIEDLLSRARTAVGMPARQQPWSLWVRLIRRFRY